MPYLRPCEGGRLWRLNLSNTGYPAVSTKQTVLIALACALVAYAVVASRAAPQNPVPDAGERPQPQAPEPVYHSIAAAFHEQTDGLAPADLAGEIAATRISPPERTADWPAVSSAPDGTLWATYIEWDGDQSDRVIARKRADDTWSAPIAIDDGHWDHYIPSIAALPGGAVVAWSAQVDGNYELFAARCPSPKLRSRVDSAACDDR
jgi:hypothetical protein